MKKEKVKIKEPEILNACPPDCPYMKETASDEHCAACIEKAQKELEEKRNCINK